MTTQLNRTAFRIHENNHSIVDFTYSYRRKPVSLSLHGCYLVAEKDTKNSPKDSLNAQLVLLADQMHKYIAVNHFYYDAVAALLGEDEMVRGISEHSCYGLTLITHWLCNQDKMLLETLEQITTRIASMDNDDKANN